MEKFRKRKTQKYVEKVTSSKKCLNWKSGKRLLANY